MTKTAIVLGGMRLHILLIEKLRKRGYYTILVDYLDRPPAYEAADEHVQISTYDIDAIRALAVERKADLIINCCLEFLNVGIAKLAEELNLPTMYPYETALNVSDKVRMKTIMRENGIPTTDFICVDKVSQLEGMPLAFPVFAKPSDGTGSTGVAMAKNWKDLYEITEKAIQYSKSGVAIVEEAAVGQESNVYCAIQGGIATMIGISQKYSIIGGDGDVTRALGSIWPAQFSEQAIANIKAAAQKIADAFHLNNTPMFMQILVNGDDIDIIEFACRMAGGYSYRNILSKYGFDFFDFTIDCFLGVKHDVKINDMGEYYAINSLYATPCIFDHVEGMEELLKQNTIVDYMLPRNPGTAITGETQRKSKIGYFIAKGKSKKEVLEKIQYVFDHIEAFDDHGNKVLRRDIYLNQSVVE
jgi:phosphoribosylamine-glycine ligase